MTLANAPVEQLLGWKPEHLIGQHVKVIWPRRFRRQYLDLLCAIRDERPLTGPAREGEFLLARKDGGEVTVRVAARWIDTDRGPISLCALTDLTERDRVEQLLRSLAERDPPPACSTAAASRRSSARRSPAPCATARAER